MNGFNFLKYNQFVNESIGESIDYGKRSGRLLTQEQISNKLMEASSEKLPCIMFTDVVGSSKMWSDDKLIMKKRIDDHFDLMNAISIKFNGFIVKTIGDAFMIYFEASDDALMNAIECGIQIIKSEALPLRIGICQGDMQEKTYTLQGAKLKDYFGNVVNVASRLESDIADPEGIAFASIIEVPKEITDKYKPKLLKGKSNPNLRGASMNKIYKIKP
jgi:class 3 adenylate cyclase